MLSSDAAARILAVHGEGGAAWLRQRPGRIAALAAEWGLVELGPPFPEAHANLVLPVQRGDGVRLVLKLTPSTESTLHEAQALGHWAGRGAVRLEAVDASRSALLLEHLRPGTPLAGLCAEDDRAATAIAAGVISRLRAAGTEFGGTLPALASWTERLREVPRGAGIWELARAGQHAHAVATELLAESRRSVVLHADLHHGNVLSAQRGPWLAIDPKGLVGPPEAEAAALLRNPRRFLLSHPNPLALLSDRLDVLAEHLGDDARRLAGWGYVLAVLAAHWAFEDREDADVRRWLACAEVLGVSASARGAFGPR